LLRSVGVDPAICSAEVLTGGVSSDIVKITADDRVIAVKRALPKLKVAADWRAPVERNLYEVEWLKAASRIVPDNVPEVLSHDADSGSFAMTYLDPESYPVWKGQLRAGKVDIALAAAVGRTIGRIHQATAGNESLRTQFATDHIFHPIRLEPYLEATALRHPNVSGRLLELSSQTLMTKQCLVHGDVSPKNILVGPRGPIFLDAECAWYGDPAFDLAFCLNHLLLKGVWNRAASSALLEAFSALSEAYFSEVSWTSRSELEARAAQLLPALFLARVDGKSPVEYITDDADRDLVRSTALPLLETPAYELQVVRTAWAHRLKL
jgi:5-methylthioribose kinase